MVSVLGLFAHLERAKLSSQEPSIQGEITDKVWRRRYPGDGMDGGWGGVLTSLIVRITIPPKTKKQGLSLTQGP